MYNAKTRYENTQKAQKKLKNIFRNTAPDVKHRKTLSTQGFARSKNIHKIDIFALW